MEYDIQSMLARHDRDDLAKVPPEILVDAIIRMHQEKVFAIAEDKLLAELSADFAEGYHELLTEHARLSRENLILRQKRDAMLLLNRRHSRPPKHSGGRKPVYSCTDRDRVRDLRNQGRTYSEIAEDTGMSRNTVWRIIKADS